MEFTLNGEVSELSHLANEIAQFCAAHKLAQDPEYQLNLVLDELFTNAIRHGGCAGVASAVAVRLKLAENAVLVIYRDRGIPFDPLSVPPPDLTLPLELRPVGGLGVHFVRQTMRQLQYDRSGEWNQLTMELAL